jgi:hypothetical protein
MFHLLILLYGKTAAGFGKVGLQKIIAEQGGTLKAKAIPICKALTSSGLLLYEGGQKGRKYRWNLKEWGPVSIPIAEAMCYETSRQQTIRQNEYQKMKRRRLKSLTTLNE